MSQVEDQVRDGEGEVGQQGDDDEAPLQPDGGRGQDDRQPQRGPTEVAHQVLAERRREIDRRHVRVEAPREERRPQAEHPLDAGHEYQPRPQQRGRHRGSPLVTHQTNQPGIS
jgi:hypothetical protein